MSDDTKHRLPLKYWKMKEALRTIDRNIALVNDPFVQLMLEAKYGRGTCKAIQRLEELRLRHYKRSAAGGWSATAAAREAELTSSAAPAMAPR
jgi:hypothetical protein